jgi:hypothetical protein
MRQPYDGKNIAILFYARALAIAQRVCAIVFVCGICSTGLTFSLHAAAKMPPRAVENLTQPINLDAIKPLKELRVIRTNTANHAFEEVTFQEKTIGVKRSTGFEKSLPFDAPAFKAIEQQIRSLGTFEPKVTKPVDGVKVEVAIRTEDGESRFEVDPAGRLHDLYADLMTLRNKVLTDAK